MNLRRAAIPLQRKGDEGASQPCGSAQLKHRPGLVSGILQETAIVRRYLNPAKTTMVGPNPARRGQARGQARQQAESSSQIQFRYVHLKTHYIPVCKLAFLSLKSKIHA